jgi:hypothetical protein
VSQGRRRRSRLFSGSPELLLVSEDIPGIVMPAPPSRVPSLEVDDVPQFDLGALHAQEDAEEAEALSEGPLRLFIGAPAGGDDIASPVEPEAEEEGPIWDVSALAMPEASDEEAAEIRFLDEDELVEEDDLITIDAPPPPLVMSVSVDEAIEGMSPPSDWEDTPTVPAQLSPAVIRVEAPPIRFDVDASATDLPDRDLFDSVPGPMAQLAERLTAIKRGEDIPTQVDAIMAIGGDDEELSLIENEWADDDLETEFFGDPGGAPASSAAVEPRRLASQPPRPSPAFRPIPEKVDPPVVPILVVLVGFVLLAVFSVVNCGDSAAPQVGTVENPVRAQPASQPGQPVQQAAPEVAPVGSVGFLTVETNRAAIIYVDNVKQGTSPVRNIELTPGNHKVRALTIETGHRQVVTAHVVAGENRRVVLEFQ